MTEKAILKKLGKRIKALREERNISQQELASACNFEKANMSRLESGNTNPTFLTLNKIAKALSVSVSEITDI
jgi:putative transcriptional regulator